eukprot:TRINITY_DN8513_c0_g1_i1.p1 TRINITY_DN8513_c0_g1~~TRINITY_DN8513_c0_g1_i1.p1  ORF type:complete len:178 (-),score=27.03 TRINITY_DN8513_c0_g1_i1:33-488(-)
MELVQDMRELFRQVFAADFPGLVVWRSFHYNHFRTPLHTGDLAELKILSNNKSAPILYDNEEQRICMTRQDPLNREVQSNWYDAPMQRLFYSEGVPGLPMDRFVYMNVSQLMDVFRCCHRGKTGNDCLHYLMLPFGIWNRMLSMIISLKHG